MLCRQRSAAVVGPEGDGGCALSQFPRDYHLTVPNPNGRKREIARITPAYIREDEARIRAARLALFGEMLKNALDG
jgi:hypothetical protein